jgi:hypothetical protein
MRFSSRAAGQRMQETSSPSDIQWLDTRVVDAEVAAPAGRPCEACGTPVEPMDRFCPACRVENPRYRPANAVGVEEGGFTAPSPRPSPRGRGSEEALPLAKHFQCQTCGAEVATDPGQRSYVCPFCDSTYVVELPPEQTGRQAPEFVIGFAVTAEQAHEAYRKWLHDNDWFRPGDLAKASVADKLKGIYLPFWAFTMRADSVWQAQIGEYWYRTETYTTRDSKGNLRTHTRRVRETEWWPLAGRHHRYYNGYLVSGSKGLPHEEAQRIQPFQLPALKRYEPYFLAGWLAEEYSVGREEALAKCQEEFQRREQGNIGSFLPGDTYSGLAVQTEFSQVSSDLCLLPVYILSYRYQDKVYRFLMNGQTGKIAGDKPVSMGRIAIVVGIGIAILVIVVVMAMILSRGGR